MQKWLEILKILVKEWIPTFFWQIVWKAAADIWLVQGLWLQSEKGFDSIDRHTCCGLWCVVIWFKKIGAEQSLQFKDIKEEKSS